MTLLDFIASRPHESASSLRVALQQQEPCSRLLSFAGVAKELGQQTFLTIYAKLDGHPAGRALLAVVSARGDKGADWSDPDLRSGLTAAAELELLTTTERDQLLLLGERAVWQGLSGLAELPNEQACARAQAFVRAETSLRQKLQQLSEAFNAAATAVELLALAGLE